MFSTLIYFTGLDTSTGSAYVGLGQVDVDGTRHLFTDNHIGFKITTSGGVSTLSATQANGTTESATALTTLVATDVVEVILVVNSTTSVDYYYRLNGAASLSSATNISANMPNTTTV